MKPKFKKGDMVTVEFTGIVKKVFAFSGFYSYSIEDSKGIAYTREDNVYHLPMPKDFKKKRRVK